MRLLGALLVCLVAPAQVRERGTTETREETIRDILEKFNPAYQQKDVEAICWDQYRDDFLYNAFSRPMPASTWEVNKIVTSPEMPWAHTKSAYRGRRKGREVGAELYQLFILQKSAASSSTKAKSTAPTQTDWKIVAIDYSFHVQPLNPQARPDQPQGTQPRQ